MKIASRTTLLFLLAANTSSAIDLGDILGIDCLSTNDPSELKACANDIFNNILDEVGDLLNIECLTTAGTDLDLLYQCIDQTASDLLIELGDITGIDCLTGSTEPQVLADCAAEQLGPLVDCFDTTDTAEIIKCANETNNEIFGVLTAINIPSCVDESLAALAECAVENAETCASSCDGVSLSPLQALSYSDMTCTGLQSGLMTPLCDVVSCCPACVLQLEAVAECVANDVLVLNDDSCDLTCAAARRELRNLGDTITSNVEGEGTTEESILHCGTDLEGQRRTITTAETMLECATAEYLNTIEQNGPDTSGGSRAGAVMATAMVIVAFMW